MAVDGKLCKLTSFISINFYFQQLKYSMIGKPRESKASNALYEQVLTKNFEIIESFLTQFHEIFQKQDQFEALVGRIEHRISLTEQNNKRLEDLMLKSSDMYQKKMKSLKQFILEKLKASADKATPSPHPPAQQPIPLSEIKKQSNPDYEKQMIQQKKLQQNLSQHMKKLQWQLVTVNQRINSLTALTNNLDERMGASIRLDRKDSEKKQNMYSQHFQMELQSRIQLVIEKLNGSADQFWDALATIDKKISHKYMELTHSIEQLQQVLKQKVNKQQYEQFKLSYKNDQSCMVREIQQAFANKKQTKRSFYLLQKKILKLQLMEQMMVTEMESQNRLTIDSSSNSLYKKIKQGTVHSKKKQAKGSIIANNSALNVRRLSNRKFGQQKIL